MIQWHHLLNVKQMSSDVVIIAVLTLAYVAIERMTAQMALMNMIAVYYSRSTIFAFSFLDLLGANKVVPWRS